MTAKSDAKPKAASKPSPAPTGKRAPPPKGPSLGKKNAFPIIK